MPPGRICGSNRDAHPPRPVPAPQAAAPGAAAPRPRAMNPYAKMKAPTGGFDLRSVDDGIPAANVRSGRGKAVLFASVLVGAVAFVLGGWSGMVERRPLELQHREQRRRARSRPRSRACRRRSGRSAPSSPTARSVWRRTRRTRWRYDPQFIANLEKIKLDPRPNTAKIFRVDYFRLPDADVDKLFNYYYDSIALYGEVERHIKKSKADAESLKAFAEKGAAAGTPRRTTASCSTTARAS